MNLKKNTFLRIGIICVSFFSFVSFLFSGVQIQLRHPRPWNPEKTASLVSEGVERVIIRVFQDDEKHGGLFFENSHFRVINPYLEEFSSRLAGRIELWAWMLARKFSWSERRDLFDYHFSDGRLQLLRRFDLFNPDAVAKVSAVLAELAAKRIDGILLQDDLVLRHNEGLSNWGRAFFFQRHGFRPDLKDILHRGSPRNLAWQQLKTARVNQVLRAYVQSIKSRKPGLPVAMNIYYETPVFADQSIAWYAHELDGILASGLDQVYLMAYHRQIKEEKKLSEAENRRLFQEITARAAARAGDKLVVKLQVRDFNSGELLPVAELRDYLRLVPAGIKICFMSVEEENLSYLRAVRSGR